MNRFLKSTILSAALAATTLTALAPAEAGGGWHHHNNSGDVVAAGVLGLAAGALAAGALAPPYRPVYDYYDGPVYAAPPPPPVRRYYVEPRAAYYRGGLEPWSPEWYRYCGDRYRSFDPNSGTFVGYDGREHFCVAN